MELDFDELETVLETLKSLPERTPAQERLRVALQEVYDNAAEEYWSEKWGA